MPIRFVTIAPASCLPFYVADTPAGATGDVAPSCSSSRKEKAKDDALDPDRTGCRAARNDTARCPGSGYPSWPPSSGAPFSITVSPSHRDRRRDSACGRRDGWRQDEVRTGSHSAHRSSGAKRNVSLRRGGSSSAEPPRNRSSSSSGNRLGFILHRLADPLRSDGPIWADCVRTGGGRFGQHRRPRHHPSAIGGRGPTLDQHFPAAALLAWKILGFFLALSLISERPIGGIVHALQMTYALGQACSGGTRPVYTLRVRNA